MLGDTPMQSKQAEIAQEDITYHSNIPAAKGPDFYHPHEMFASPMAQPSLSSYAAEESTYTIGAGVYQAEPMAAPHGYTSQGYRLSDDAESEAPNPESLASSPRSGATTPRTASRPATPRERVQQQIALNEQKRRLRRQACSTPPMFHALAEKAKESSGLSLHAQSLALVYDPELENPKDGERTPRRDPALRRAALSFYADMAFLAQPGPSTGPLQCFIVRSRGAARLYPRYSLYLDVGHKFLMAARKRKKSKASNYVMSLDEKDLQRNSGSSCGMVQSNFLGTEFTIYDRGMSGVTALSPKDVHSEVAAVRYDVNVLGTKGPRKMTAIVPAIDTESGRPVAPSPSIHADNSIMDRHKRGHGQQDTVVMRNKPPKWNEQLSAYCLNFKGRVTQASVKNFQLISEADPEAVLLQFGKVGDDTFSMDYQWPLSAVQAFGIALTSFDSKLACE
ncbi:g10202 [Coccomyxa viridis]|uniref:Tubby-like F-box protein n=1 Tax=Coccomyxa viridis TaxID=1274662 RepID=A0ABP1G4R0_9CHLO